MARTPTVCTVPEGECSELKSGYSAENGWLASQPPRPPRTCSSLGTAAELEKCIDKALKDANGAQLVIEVSGVHTGTLTLAGLKNVHIRAKDAVLSGTGMDCRQRKTAISIIDADHVIVEGFQIEDYRTCAGKQDAIGMSISGRSHHVALVKNLITRVGVDWNLASTISPKDLNGAGIKVRSAARATEPCKKDEGIRNIYIGGNELHDLDLGYSEALTISGNVCQFDVTGNRIHDVDNIGIDIIGGEVDEGQKEGEGPVAQQGLVCGNEVRALRCGNPSYHDESVACPDGEGQWPNAGGIYVDGASHTTIDRNCVDGFDQGIQVSAEEANPTAKGIVISNNRVQRSRVAGIDLGYRGDGTGLPSADEGTQIRCNCIFQCGDGAPIQVQKDSKGCKAGGNEVEGGGPLWLSGTTSCEAMQPPLSCTPCAPPSSAAP
jgi:hypothetical protein